jgi:uncharacterized protein (DUF1501 family)
MKRRDFLKTGLKAGIALNALPLMVGNSTVRALGRSPLRGMLETLDTGNNNVLVIVQLAGGNDGLNTLVPYGDTNYQALRSPNGLRLSKDLINLTDHDTLAWHSAMRGMSELWDDGSSKRMAIIQNVGYPNPNLSHFRGTDIWNTSTDSNIYASTGWLGRYFNNAKYSLSTTAGDWPIAIQFGNNLSNAFLAQTGGMGIALGQFPTQSSPTGHRYDAIPPSPTTQYQELDYIRTIQTETETYANTIYDKVVNVTPPVANRVSYPKSNLATDLSNIARVIVTQMNDTTTQTRVKVFLVTQNGYDTHSNQLTGQAKLLGDLSDALLAFQKDIEAMGVADNVAVMTYSEFGRRPQENGSGTDHGTAAPHFIISTKVKPQILGRDPDLSDNATTGLVAGNLSYQYDFRSVYATVLNEWLLAGSSDNWPLIDKVLKTDDNGTYSNLSAWRESLGIFQAPPPQDVARNSEGPGLMLMQNYPNPASKITTFEYALPATGPVALSIYDARGVEIERVVDARQEYGVQRASFDVSRLPAGTYLYRLKTNAGEVAQQMVVVH